VPRASFADANSEMEGISKKYSKKRRESVQATPPRSADQPFPSCSTIIAPPLCLTTAKAIEVVVHRGPVQCVFSITTLLRQSIVIAFVG
jgi:hypothetical protein